ncbi:DUF3329 domain-containing protein [Paenibacillus wynnii]|uniref:DUF3329 domain-containing protein n=1 Tax=Paenibacillus wynnii TaxID=268407 RepID=UPI002791FA94|nr:DUF6056 family protein [Paenibacillus wynnii]MDQ0194125.1 hypothetical protein [Paenibacillus wynnii]
MKFTKYSSLYLLALLFAYMASINYLIPLFADDFNYSFMWDKSKRIENLMDVIRSQYMHYFEWGGRTVAHTLGQILLMSDKWVIALSNSLMFVLLITLIFWHSQGKRPGAHSGVLMLMVIFFCWTSLPSFGTTAVWLIGSVNYLWMSVIILLFLLPYRLQMLGKNSFRDHTISRAGMLLLGGLAGWTNENTAITALVLTFIMLTYFYKVRRLYIWMLTGFGGAIIGCLFLLLAPGNRVRAEGLQTSADASFFLTHIKMPLLTTFHIMMYQLPMWILLAIIVSFVLHQLVSKRYAFAEMKRDIGIELMYSLLMICLSVFNNLIMFASPMFPLRAGFGSTVFLIIGVMSFLKLDRIGNYFSTQLKVISIPVSLILVISMGLVMTQYMKLWNEDHDRLQIVADNKRADVQNVVVEPYSIKASSPYQDYFGHVFVADIGKETGVWPNTIYAKYLELDSIKIK